MRNRRTLPSRQRTYVRLRVRVDRLEDAISHFYNVINELRRRVSTLEKKLKPLPKDDYGSKSPEAAAGEGTMNATALGWSGQLCCCTVSCGVGPSLVDDRFLVHER
jgi:hypothetical protein